MELEHFEWPYLVHVTLSRQDLDLMLECFEVEAALEPDSTADPEDRYKFAAANAMCASLQAMTRMLAEAEGRLDAIQADRAPMPAERLRGVVGVRCACCGELKFVENRDACERRQETGEQLICDACMALPEDEAEETIRARDQQRMTA